MQLANPFTQETRLLWLYWYACLICGGNGNERGGMELHHITGRDSNSALNGAVLCKECHGQMIHTQDEERGLVVKVMQILAQKGYKLVPNDLAFLEAHPYLLVHNPMLDKWLA